ncbi:putative transposase YdaD [Pedobacter africanus]|uniref:Transposase YdaD n=1 Tax=Pedobacter africanus TaxID=151894 RepID=A0ACC6L413_9SPHI|nr:hypothetical protein [Pedobacter africanus]MDR6786385.1 putative transposase YdaD [Pedobacter africanus]
MSVWVLSLSEVLFLFSGRHEEAIEIARKLKKEGLSVEFIAKTTGLTIEEIEFKAKTS